MAGALAYGWLLLLVLLVYVSVLLLGSRRGKRRSVGRVRPRCNFGDIAAVRSIQGSRPHMEDSYYADACVKNDSSHGLFAVFDGHGGHRASDYTAEHLHHMILNNSQHRFDEEPLLAIEAGFRQLDQAWLTLATRNGWDDGSTAVVALIVNRMLYVGNVGDSRCVVSHAGKAVDMSLDHKPVREDEKMRIEKLGGRIIRYGTWRVEGVLAVTRAIGDRRLKKYVSAVPEIRSRLLKEGDDWLILATDGVWDVFSSQDAVNLVCQAKDANEAAYKLTEMAYKRGSLDNITALVVDLAKYRARMNTSSSVPSAPSPSPLPSSSLSLPSPGQATSPASPAVTVATARSPERVRREVPARVKSKPPEHSD